MKIDRIVRKDEKNVMIYFDNDEKLILSYEVFMKGGLRKNDVITEDGYSLLISENKKYFLKQRALRYLGRRHHSANELKLKLKQKNYNMELVDSILGELKESGFINDYDFAKAFTEENIKNKFWGRKKIESELFKRGVDREIIIVVLDEKFSVENETANAMELGRKKLRTLINRGYDNEKIISKLVLFLISRGYDYETSRKTAEIIIEKNADESGF